MDIANIKPTGKTMEIKHPVTGDNIGIRLSLISMEDDKVMSLKRSITDRRLDLERKNKSIKASDLEDNQRKLTFAVVSGWEWYNPTGKPGDDDYDADAMPNFHGDTDPDFNPKNFNAIYDELYWFGRQVQEEVSEEKDFFNLSK